MSPRSKSSARWLKEHFRDPYVQKAQAEGYRSRAVYKLLEIQERDRLIKKGMTIVDLGAAPGGWLQVFAKYVGKSGFVVGVDLLAMEPMDNVVLIQGDFMESTVLEAIYAALNGRPVDLVASDMAPNMSGNKAIDQPRMMYLAELALDFAEAVLKPDGSFLVKVFQGESFEAYLKGLRARFKQVLIRKPKASRGRSAEVYLVGRGRRSA